MEHFGCTPIVVLVCGVRDAYIHSQVTGSQAIESSHREDYPGSLFTGLWLADRGNPSILLYYSGGGSPKIRICIVEK